MTTRNGSVYYVKRRFRGIGQVERSLHTTRKARADELERMLLKLHGQGRLDLIRAWLVGKVEIEELADAYDTGTLHALADRVARESVSVKQAASRFRAARRGAVAQTTLDRYETGLAHFERLVGGMVRDAVTESAIEGFKEARAREGVKRGTINNDLVAVSVLASYCVRQGWLAKRPRIKKYPSPTRIRYLDAAQIAVYMAALRPAFRAQHQLLIATGMRLGEVEALRRSDVRFHGDGSARCLVEKKAKTATSVRPVYVPAWAAEILRDQCEGLSGNDRVFRGVKRRAFQAEHARACKMAGIAGYTIHDHRHTAAVHLSMAGMPLGVLKDQLGHATISQTMKYARFHPEYADVGGYFQKVATELGLKGKTGGKSKRGASDESV